MKRRSTASIDMVKKLRNAYHFFLAWLGSVLYRHPSDELLVIGVTGTSGKSSVIHWLREVLETAGFTVGSLSTVDFYIAGRSVLNDKKMTMLGRMRIQKYLRHMVRAGCGIAIVEMTSEGELQYRNKFINGDVMALTNLYPEHIEAHGSFENYKNAKLRLFEYVSRSRRKDVRKTRRLKDMKLAHATARIPKIAVVNADIEYAEEFLQFPFDERRVFSASNPVTVTHDLPVMIQERITATRVRQSDNGIAFAANGRTFSPRIYGTYNASNLACVIAIVRSLHVEWETIEKAVNTLRGAPGRVESIPEAEARGFRVIVDYAFEPVALRGLYDIVRGLQPKRVIHVLGGTGGGRDTARRGVMGEMAGKNADIVIVTNEDPYDEDPRAIMDMVAAGARVAGKKDGENLFVLEDRREAIGKAVGLAEPGDTVLVTGKGSEQRMCLARGKMIPWDDREVVRRALP